VVGFDIRELGFSISAFSFQDCFAYSVSLHFPLNFRINLMISGKKIHKRIKKKKKQLGF